MLLSSLGQALLKCLKDTVHVAKNLFIIIIPIVIFIKILQELDLMEYFAMPLAPIMEMMGLPSELGIVWVSSMCVGIYSGLALLPGILATLPALTVEQTTVLGIIILIAHGLILETKIAGQCNVSMSFQLFLRVITAIVAGLIFHLFCQYFGLWQEEAVIFLVQQSDSGFLNWVFSEILNLVQIFCFIYFILLINMAMNKFKISDFLSKICRPFFRLLGLSAAATNIMLVGLFMGLLYGGGLMIKEAKEGTLTRSDTFAAMSFISIAHALIEDTILLMFIGGTLWGLLFFRFVVAFIVGVIINLVFSKNKSTAEV